MIFDEIELLEPEIGERREHFPLVGNRRGQNAIKSRDAVGRDKKQGFSEIENLSDFAAAQFRDSRKGTFEKLHGSQSSQRETESKQPGLSGALWQSLLDDRIGQRTDPFDLHGHRISRNQPALRGAGHADSMGSSGHDDGAGQERGTSAEKLNQSRHIEDHIVCAPVLQSLAAYGRANLQVVGVLDLVARHDAGSQRTKRVERLGSGPLPAPFFLLPIPRADVVGASVSQHVVERFCPGNIFAALANDNCQFAFVIHLVAGEMPRKDDRVARILDRGHGFHKLHRVFGNLRLGFLRVPPVVETDRENLHGIEGRKKFCRNRRVAGRRGSRKQFSRQFLDGAVRLQGAKFDLLRGVEIANDLHNPDLMSQPLRFCESISSRPLRRQPADFLPLPMRLSLFVMPLVLASFAGAAELPFYIGTYTGKPPSQGIYSAVLDTDSGEIKSVALAGEITSPSYLAISPDGSHLYSTSEGKPHAVAAFARAADQKLTLLNTLPSGGDGACHVSVDNTGKVLFAANYNGTFAAFKLREDGSLEGQTAFEKFTGSGPNQGRQKSSHAHSAFVSPDNRHVYVCDLGSDKIWIFRLDAGTGKLTSAEPTFAQTPAGGGPRHLLFYKDYVYANNELTNTVTAYRRDARTGALEPIQTISTLAEGTDPNKVTNAAIKIHPSGRWLYISNRTCDTVAVFSTAEDGTLKLVQSVPAGVAFPRDFSVDPTGRWLVIAGQKNNKIAVHKIDPATGFLSLADKSVEVGEPVCILFPPEK